MVEKEAKSLTKRPIRVLAIHRYFWPDTPPYASMLRAIVKRWAADGHEVEVFSTQPSYKREYSLPRQSDEEEMDGVRVTRVSLPPDSGRTGISRLSNTVRFCYSIFQHAFFRKRFDVIMISTVPPIMGAMTVSIISRLTKAKFIYHCMDIHPEIGRISGEFKNKVVYSILYLVDKFNCLTADRIVVLSMDMANVIRNRLGCGSSKTEIINNFELPSFQRVDSRELPLLPIKKVGNFRIVFAGNIGRFQGLETVVDAMHLLRDRADVEMVFIGEGKLLGQLRSRAGNLIGDKIHFIPHQPVEIAKEVITTADLCFVSLRPEVYRFAYPSKTMTYLGAGRPLLVAVEEQSDLARFIREEEIGLVVPPGDARATANAILKLMDSQDVRKRMLNRSRLVAEKYFSERRVLNNWSSLLMSVTQGISVP